MVQVECQGEVLVLKETVNHVTSRLLAVVTQTIHLGREVAERGVLGGKIQVEGLQGMWKTMVETTNSMATGKCFLEQYSAPSCKNHLQLPSRRRIY